jgi:hypothetical protein
LHVAGVKLSLAACKTDEKVTEEKSSVLEFITEHLHLVMNIKGVNFCVDAEFHLQSLGAVLVEEEVEIVALTINALVARTRPGNQTDEMHLAVTLEIPEIHGRNMRIQGEALDYQQ